MKRLNLLGERFGKLIVVSSLPNKGRRSYWMTRCDCGEEVESSTELLRDGRKRSCGCIRITNDLKGQKLGYWTVLEYAGRERWKCICQCGTMKNILRTSLSPNIMSSSCGCFKSPPDHIYNEKMKKRILKYVKKNENGCWEWTGYKDIKGYANMTYRKNTGLRTSRVSWAIWTCVNPDHLWLGTQQDNMNDMKAKGRAYTGKKPKLHKFTKRKKNV